MINTVNKDTYGKLLATYQPHVIETEEENEYFLEIIEELMHRSELTPEEEKILDLLVKLVEDFENEFYPIESSTPPSRLNHLIESRDLDKRDILFIFNSLENLEAILAGESPIDPSRANQLAEFFHVDPSLFLESDRG